VLEKSKTLTRYPGLVVAVCLALSALAAYAIDLNALTINGYTSFEYELQIEPDDDGDGDPNDSFDADLMDLVFNFQVSDQIRAAMDVSFEHRTTTEDDRGNVALEYGFVEYSFSDLFKIRAGKMFTPLGIFNEIHTAKPAYLSVKEAPSTNKPERIVDAAARFFPRWGVGLGIIGNGEINGKTFDYNLLLRSAHRLTIGQRTNRVSTNHPILIRRAADNHQRHPGLFEDGGGEAQHRTHSLRSSQCSE